MRSSGIGILLTILLAGVSWAGIADPRKDFLDIFASADEEDVITTEADLNGDGVPEVLVSLTTMHNGRMGNIWVLYKSVPEGGYERVESLADGAPLEFHRKAASIQPRADGTNEIVCYMASSASSGLVGSYQLGPEGLTQSLSGEIAPLGNDAPTYDRLFKDETTQLSYVYENAGKLKNRYFPFRRLTEKLSLVQWGVVIVGLLMLVMILIGVLRGVAGAMARKRNP